MKKEWNAPEVSYIEFADTENGRVRSDVPDSSWVDDMGIGNAGWGES